MCSWVEETHGKTFTFSTLDFQTPGYRL
uniref:Uncharacterized protein n=1 Tax=Anguilla anguilla TaxID=7936 RepID=A0A0E9VNQ7_ANGAN